MATKHHNNYSITFWYALITASFILSLLLSSCSCNWHYKRLAKKCPIQKDTLIVHDTIRTETIKTDTLFRSVLSDTVYIQKDKLRIKYVRLPGDSVYIQGRCLGDTIYIEKKVPYDFIQPQVDYYPGWLKWSVILFLILILIGWVLKKFT